LIDNNNSNIQPLRVPIDSLQLAKWDVRRNAENSEEFESFKNSIHENGLINPLTVAKMTNSSDLIIVAGRRRYRAIKELGWKNVLVLIQFKDVTEIELRRISLIENLQRKELVDIEKGFGILEVYKTAGYTGDEAIKGNKAIDNYLINTKKKWDNIESKELTSVLNKRGFQANLLRYDQKFVEICKSTGYTPRYQCQLLQIVLQLDPDVLNEAQKAELSTDKKLLLTKSKLREHPKIQKNLIPKLKKLDPSQGAVLVNQKLRDIETGYIEPVTPGSETYVYSEKPSSEREVVAKGDTNKITDLPTAIELDIIKESNKLIRLLTGRALTKGENRYTEQIVDKNTERMLKIAKSFNKEIHDIDALYEPLKMLQYTLRKMQGILTEEIETAEKQKELCQK
jgi:hypothetical protein